MRIYTGHELDPVTAASYRLLQFLMRRMARNQGFPAWTYQTDRFLGEQELGLRRAQWHSQAIQHIEGGGE